jgi:Protein of unknown function (DUF3109)
MLIVGNAILSDDILEKHFVCDLLKCKGACCVEGDLGAPLLESELVEIEKNMVGILPYLDEEGKEVIAEEGYYLTDFEGDLSTTTVNNRECVFAVYDDKDILHCGIEKAWRDGKSTFQKPISCHLYPIRVSKYGENEALNYSRWDICSPACAHGDQLKVPIYKFLKGPLVRKYGDDWYDDLERQVGERE